MDLEQGGDVEQSSDNQYIRKPCPQRGCNGTRVFGRGAVIELCMKDCCIIKRLRNKVEYQKGLITNLSNIITETHKLKDKGELVRW